MSGLLDGGIQALLFDMDGTLLDSVPQSGQAGSAALAKYGYKASPEAIIEAIGSRLFVEIIPDWFGTDVDETQQIFQEFRRMYYEEFVTQAPAFPHAPELLQQLRDDGYRLAIVTNRSEVGAHSGVKWAGWEQHFEVVVGQDTAARAKPYPDPAHFALEALGVDPGAAAFIGDNETDIRCGAAAGLAAVVAIAQGDKADLLRSIGATHVSSDLHGLHELFYGSPA